jgi:hypothetical protein
MKIKLLLFIKYFFLVFLFITFIPYYSVSEFYQYINKDGVKCYTDDPSLVSDIEDTNIIVHKDKYDGLDEKEKKKLKDREKQEALKLKLETQEALDHFKRNERINDAKKAKEKLSEKSTTPVRIFRNRILVPVTIGYLNREVTTELLLDTGASITVIHDLVADQLEIDTGKNSAVRVAGGGFLRTKIVEIEYIKVGPKIYKGPVVMVLNNKGPATDHQGLLGQDFLSHFNYTIDYSKNRIIWR